MAISMMGRGAAIDPQTFAERQKMADLMFQRSLVPAQNEQSWTQGLARMLQGGIAGYDSAQVNKDREAYKQQRMSDMQKLGSAIGNGNYKDIISELQDPDSQMAALGFLKSEMDNKNKNKNDMQSEIFKNRLGMQRDKAKETFKSQNDPMKNVQGQLNDAANQASEVDRLLASTQDPLEREKLQSLSDNLKATQESLTKQVRGVKGIEPDLRKEYSNQGFAALASGANPNSLSPAQAEAMRSISLTPKLEPAMNAEIGKGIGQDVNEDVRQFKEGASASRDIASKGSQILQMLATNPDIDGGWGKEKITGVQTIMNRLFPGIAPNVADQQSLQKLVGQLTPQAVGNLRQEGVQRITQGEIMNLIPKITATMENDREGMKQIIELHTALDAPIQKANAAMLQLRNQYAKNPGSFDIGTAMNDLQLALKDDVQAESLKYMNNKLARRGEKLVINPNWDEKLNTLDKYSRVPLSRSGG